MVAAPALSDIHALIAPQLGKADFQRRGNLYRKFGPESVGLIEF